MLLHLILYTSRLLYSQQTTEYHLIDAADLSKY